MAFRSILRCACARAEPSLRPAALLFAGSLAAACLAAPSFPCAAQQPGQLSDSTAALQGVVTNAATNQPLARALVHIEGNADAGALTDVNGRYEFPDVPLGPQVIEVRKPGFLDSPVSSGSLLVGPPVGPAHTVWVAAQMPDVNFALTPTAAIRGQITLSTGDPAEGIVVNLAQRTVAEGRSIWQQQGRTKTNSDGAYRFAGLPAGDYIVFTDPAMDSQAAEMPIAAASASAVERQGYAAVFFPSARRPSDAQPITLHPGDQADADIALTLEPFHPVIATAALPAALKPDAAFYSASVLDASGRQLPYPTQYDAATRTVQAQLPDGAYTLMLTAMPQAGAASAPDARPQPLSGAVDLSVAGHALSGLRIAVSPVQPSPVELNLQSSGLQPTPKGYPSVLLSQATGWIDDAMLLSLSTGSDPALMNTGSIQPGVYRVHTHPQMGWCVSSFTAGGADLAREPLLIGPSGAPSPIQLTLRDDCATLSLRLPSQLSLPAVGEENFYTVYVIPQFDTTTGVEPVTLRPSAGGRYTLSGLAPGDYRVYTFAQPVLLEYRNPQAMAALPVDGQSIMLSPGATADLVVEVPQP